MSLNHQDYDDIRNLVGQGYAQAAIADVFRVTPQRVSQIVQSPATPEEVQDVRDALERLRQLRHEDQPRFAGFVGESAEFVADVFDCPPDGGDAVRDGDGNLRAGPAIEGRDGSHLNPAPGS